MIWIEGRLVCATSEEAETVRAHLAEHIRLSRAEPGCLSFEVAPSDDPLIWTVRESFVDRAAFDRHVSRTRQSEWGQATAGIRRDFAEKDA
ncbi:putative acetyltransferase [Palleronia aestuarii]|uniref:Putative acetyltransferase n=1 Tax=Palleronia aestuarii TaxID=568105 RepID=A0A2W7NEY6_9RHOB|nr:antibiotic biosynthesis monooxygenase [Palleronia aestuarii]PZX18480.1 putative acetyltransferase [Palleronia aestuarii]